MRIIVILCLLVTFGCKKKEIPFEENYTWHDLKVTASAYNSVKNQTDSNPHITAFGDSLKPGLNYIAVSRDLYRKGLKRDTPVKIKGFDSIFFVKDRMHPRWKNKIDIYMGTDVKAAKKWGRKKVSISYGILKPVDSIVVK
ncbi:3D (Asp-Asp-Asp) domain-containing protein [Mariniflexile fucanivorans]|uniref:3D (Asp-Asp-Asp) domain-containing protein n=1 Tax=Mariniflexile fucanivorans TaxID=264023 RepID=A0A4R1RH25_9FLAO|nr:3D (Asp-Asp-Asp) domain-containing protein [Mariniflexile fucanivorans]